MTISGETMEGYCFDEDKDAIWLEGSAQMLVAWQKAGSGTMSEYLMDEIEKAVIYETETLAGLPYASNEGTSYGDATLWPGADTLPCISSSVWYLFAKMEFDPLELGYEKDIPQEDRFW